MNVSLYVPCYNGATWLAESLDALLAQDVAADEVLVVDDGSTDGSAAIARGFGPPVRLVQHDRNRGLAVARNTALAAATHDLVGAVDADVRASSDWLGLLLDGLDAPRTAAVGGKLIEARQERLADRWRAAHMAQHAGDSPLANPPVVPGANVLVRRDVVRALGGYDGSFRTNYEDVDLQHRLIAAGYRCRYEPGAQAFHLRTDSAGSVLRTYWGWLRPPFERSGAFLSEEGLRAKGEANARLAEQALWLDFSVGTPALSYLSLLILLLFPAADLAHAATRAKERGDGETAGVMTARADVWLAMAGEALAGRSDYLASLTAADLSRLAWWTSPPGPLSTHVERGNVTRQAGGLKPLSTSCGEGWPKAGVRLDSLPRAWWPAIEEARRALGLEEGWGDPA